MKEILSRILILSGLIPASFLVLLTFTGLAQIIDNCYHSGMDERSFVVLVSMVLGLAGYLGLLFALLSEKVGKWTIILVACGLLGFILFNSFEGGTRAWIWIFTMDEPDEWFIFVWPSIIALFVLTREFISKLKARHQKKYVNGLNLFKLFWSKKQKPIKKRP